MKTTSQIVDEIYNSDVFIGGLSKRAIEAIDLIRLDAFKAGAEWAAKIVHNQALRRAGISIDSKQVTTEGAEHAFARRK